MQHQNMVARPDRRTIYPRQGDATQGHLRTVEVEEVHELDRLALSQCLEIHPFWLIIKLEVDREDLDMLCR